MKKKIFILIVCIGVLGLQNADKITAHITNAQSNTIYQAPIIKEVKKIVKSLSSETDDAVKAAQVKVQKERNQLLSEIADLQAKQEKKVERLKELESLGFSPESN